VDLIATLQCADQPGIVHAMTSSVLAAQGNIIENQQFTDPVTNSFVMRTRFETGASLDKSREVLNEGLELRELPIEIPLVVSNREDLRGLVEGHGIKFKYLPVDDKAKSEAELLSLISAEQIDFVVLARYMQILSSEFCKTMANRIINIHHSFLPGFKGAKPYHQAHAKGVKIIGATAHFVTADLDEGPIIEQDVAHVTHASTPEQLIALGRDIERRVLAKAVRLFAEDRIFIVGNRTVVFN